MHMSHELKTPVTTIIDFSDTMLVYIPLSFIIFWG